MTFVVTVSGGGLLALNTDHIVSIKPSGAGDRSYVTTSDGGQHTVDLSTEDFVLAAKLDYVLADEKPVSEGTLEGTLEGTGGR